MIADRAEHLDLPASEILRRLASGELLNVIDTQDWLRPFYWDPITKQFYFDNDEVSSYIELINYLNRTHRARQKHEALGSNQAA